jgi:hypothetical protein
VNKSEQLRTFLLNNAKRLTEEWYNSLDKSNTVGIYASTDSKVIQTLAVCLSLKINYERSLKIIHFNGSF